MSQNEVFPRSTSGSAIDGDIATIGITDYAQGQLGGTVVYVELPDIGKQVEAGQGSPAGGRERDEGGPLRRVYSPISGEGPSRSTRRSTTRPGTVNEAAGTGEGWFYKLKVKGPEGARTP